MSVYLGSQKVDTHGLVVKDEFYDTFWDTYQENGERTDYTYAFYTGDYTCWNESNFKPKYDIKPVGRNLNYMFTGIDVKNLKQILNDLGVKLDTSKYISGSYMFKQANVTHMPILDLSSAVMTPSFNNCSYLVEAGFSNITEQCIFGGIDYYGCHALVDFSVTGVIGNTDVPMSSCSKLSNESAKSVIGCLKNHFGTDTQDTYTLKFSTTVWTNLEAEGNVSPNGNTWKEYVTDLGWLT